MVGNCMECKKQDEDIYWSRFQTVQFCQVLSGRLINQQLAIPKKFVANVKEKMAGTVSLRGPSGHQWSVGLLSDNDTLLLKHGWEKFVEDHSLEEKDVLIFKYNGDSIFNVSIFDQESLCEKVQSYFITKCDHTESVRGRKRKSLEKVSEDESSDDDIIADVVRVKRTRSGTARTPPSRTQPTGSRAKGGRRVTRRGKRGSRAKRLEVKSRPREVTDEEKNRALQMAIAASTENSFLVVMRPSHITNGFYMSIPAVWARVHLRNRSKEIQLRLKGNTWGVKYHYRSRGGGFSSGGWKNFVLDNSLEEFDVCVFYLASGVHDTRIILDVKIFPVTEDATPPSKETQNSSGKDYSHGKLKKGVIDLWTSNEDESD